LIHFYKRHIDQNMADAAPADRGGFRHVNQQLNTLIKTWRTQLQPIVVDSVEVLAVEAVEVTVVAVVAVDVDADVEVRRTRNGSPSQSWAVS